MNHRPAFTLVELLISMSIGATLMALAIGVVHRTMNLQSAARAQEAGHRAAAQLSRQFRRDIHRSASVALNDGGVTLSVETPSGVLPTTYSFDGGTLIREQIQGDGRRHREQYQFGRRAQFDIRVEAEPRRVVLMIKQDIVAREASRVLVHCEAVIGRLAAFDQSPEVQE
jgi:prepilin-type N-terminal cleavage/methylation domain-containing protein